MLSAPAVEVITLRGAATLLGERESEDLVAVRQAFQGAFSGHALLIFPQANSLELVRAVSGGELSADEVAGLEQEALAETGDVILNGCMAPIANMLQRPLTLSPPQVLRGDGAALFQADGGVGDDGLVLFLYIDVSIRAHDIHGYIAMLMDLPSLTMLRRLGGAAAAERCVRRSDTGEVRWIAQRSERIEEFDAEPRQMGVIYDITSLKAAETRLRELNDELEARVAERTRERDRIWKLAPVMMVVADAQGRLQSVNSAWSGTLGWSEAEVIGRNVADFVVADDHPALAAGMATLASGATRIDLELGVDTRGGERRRIAWTAVHDDGRIHTYGRDITHQIQMEEQLRQAQKMEAVGQLTGGIAHDFNNLLTGIVGSLDLLQSRLAQGRTENLDRYIQAAQTSANRAAALTHRLLAFSRRQPLQPKSIDANALIGGMEELLRRTISERARLEVVAAGGLWPTLCDPNQLENALLNLAINARDAMPDGGRLTMETCNTRLDRAYAAQNAGVEPGQYVCICVTDTGEGMSPEVVRRAFDPFFTTKPSGKGTGLGLSMIYGFAKQSGGHAAIYSEPGRGTTVRVYLPRFRGDAGAEAPDAPAYGPRRAEMGETVLVVEDEAIVRELIVEVLEELGYHALQAQDGHGGLAILASDARVDLVVTDVGLPDISGREMVERARTHRLNLRVLFITGYAENAVFGNGHLDPDQQMITKPFPVDALAARIREMIAS